ncbi:recombinase family protein [Pseudomonas oryzihabitans]|uniref:recombinase family protein n=1 Tax=Pseudomonas oryzihabitans TaxID=47885 RepID=UPI003CEC794D
MQQIPCIRYSRWSSSKQTSGDSRQRQAAMVDRWLVNHPGAVLIDEFTDAGVSGWSGQHLSPAGELGRLVEAVESDAYPSGVHLLVETADRIGRMPMAEMLPPLMSLLRRDVVIVLLETGQTYNRKSLDGPEMYALVGALQAAHAFSERLSNRIQSAWNSRKEAGARGEAVGNRRLPLWLERQGDRAVLVEPMAVFVVECLELYCSGMGYRKAMKLARERHPHFVQWEAEREYGGRKGAKLRDAWLQHLIEKDVSVELLRGFWNGVQSYPAPISIDLWHRVKQERRRRLEGSTRAVPSRTHFLTSVAVCGVCGGAMNLKPARDKRVLFCGNKNRGGDCTNGKGIPEAVGIALYRAEAGPWVERALATRQTTPGMRRIIAINHELGEISEGVARLAGALAKYANPAFEAQMDALLAQQKTLEAERAQLQSDEDQVFTHLAVGMKMDEWQDSEHSSETLELGGLLRKVGFALTCYPDGRLIVGEREYHSLGWSRTESAYVVDRIATSWEAESVAEYEGVSQSDPVRRYISVEA